jgi:hypothetical protein
MTIDDVPVPYHLTIQERFPYAPLDRLVVQRSGADAPMSVVAELFGVSTRTLLRWKKNGLLFPAADRAAVRLGLHPSLVWPEWWSVPWADPESVTMVARDGLTV